MCVAPFDGPAASEFLRQARGFAIPGFPLGLPFRRSYLLLDAIVEVLEDGALRLGVLSPGRFVRNRPLE
jgi:hypothetical protein